MTSFRSLTLGRATAIGVALALALGCLSGEVRAQALTVEDIAGEWCGTITNYYFRPDALIVTFHKGGSNRVLEVKRVDKGVTKNGVGWLDFHWKEGGNTVFSDFTPDKQTMAQLANTGGDNGPRRIFKRCASRR